MGQLARDQTKPVLVVTGTKHEAASLPHNGIVSIVGGGDETLLAEKLALAAKSAAGIISFGMGGALDPGLRLGDWVIAERIIGPLNTPCDPPWVEALAGQLSRARKGALFADGTLVSEPATKARLAASGALVVDMESHIAAKAAQEAQIPFVALRCISDRSGDALAPAVSKAMRPDGGLALGAVMLSILRQPRQIPALIRTGWHFNHAYKIMVRDAQNLGARLAFDLR